MAVFKGSLNCVEPDLIIITCALNLSKNKAKTSYRMPCIFIQRAIGLE